MNLLHIDSSILGGNSVSRKLSADVVSRLRAGRSDVTVTYRDLAASPVPHLSAAYLAAVQAAEGQHEPALQADLEIGGATLREFLAADTVVIGVALYNFSVSSQLKAWIDRVLVAGQTFRYGADGRVEGLAGDKRAILVIARGGFYGPGSPIAAFEHAETYMRTALGFIGVSKIEAIVAEGLAVGPDQRAAAVAAAEQQIAGLAA